MKLDIRSNKRDRTGLTACRAAMLVAAMAGIVPGGQAADTVSGLVDPTRPSYVGPSADIKTAQYSGPVLQSTFVSASRRRAVISGKTYTVGDKFGGTVIADIQPYEVVLKKSGRESRLRLLPKLVKETYVVKIPANSQDGGNEK
ncbi:MAG: hypothetical protein Q7J84_12895 [Sulfuricaulis sp.]|nr:hypothetical protein [Sulfuricaulis sp.]